MCLHPLASNVTKFNAWNNRRVADWLRGHPEELMDRAVPSSCPSIRLTLAHMASAERFWLAVLKLDEEDQLAVRAEHQARAKAPEAYPDPPIEAVYAELIARSEALAAYVSDLSETELLAVCPYRSPWAESDLPRYEYVQNVINHSTYHRGQVITMAHGLGITGAPMSDYQVFNVTP